MPRGTVLALALGLTVASLAERPAFAQDGNGDPVLGKQVWLSGAPCRNCHGWAANGVQDGPQDPVGANLRKTILTPEQMSEMVRCGKPQSEMPYFFAMAWAGENKCYGMTRAEVGAMLPNRTDTTLSQRQIDAVVAFIFVQFVGKGDPTFEECTELLGANSTRCPQYPRR
jgi:mono/diheme cytochrome c family protein